VGLYQATLYSKANHQQNEKKSADKCIANIW
jgi:hypothetical protein